MNLFIVSQVFAILACILMVAIGYIKRRHHVIIAQNIQFVLFTISYACIGGIAAVVGNVVSLIRNIVCLKWNLNTPLKIFFIALQGIITYISLYNVWFNWLPMNAGTHGFFDWLPFLAATCITITLSSKDDLIIKLGCIGSILCFGTYDFILHNWTVFAFDSFSMLTSLIGVYRILKERKNPVPF
ncbi:YgjV family protein [Pseudobutyrivibrio xylanivorans]|uniref:YgjV family protein n=1 Tax=Pseudobutyrivibrio xylanivorans TaxID=185007 RepID=A0A5P6VS35_PSEXY|nr:YgjV family protein [Pseudobutyrivibrio xylanivorans]QFJ55406.1 YgjV family protein [Pseudobutyrivibrio xylanivorans]